VNRHVYANPRLTPAAAAAQLTAKSNGSFARAAVPSKVCTSTCVPDGQMLDLIDRGIARAAESDEQRHGVDDHRG
jgi:hypothetical protein